MDQPSIRLPNRYNENVELVPAGEDRWRLQTQGDHLRFGTDSATGMVSFFDPPGGPLVMLEEIIGGYVVVAIQPTGTGTYVWMLPEDADDFEQRRTNICTVVRTTADLKPAHRRFVVGMIGKAGSGKDTVGEYLCEKYGFQCMSLADPLKRGLQEMLIISDEYSNDRSKRDEPLPGMPDWTLRKLWQFVGTELMRNQVDTLIWIKSLIKRYPKTSENIVVTDVRFPDEIEHIRGRSGCPVFFIRVTRPGFVGTDVGIKNHASEIHDLEGDFTIVNSGTIEELCERVDEVMSEIESRLDE